MLEYNLKQVNENLARMALGRKTSRPMTQKEIWHEVWEKGLPFKQIQGFREVLLQQVWNNTRMISNCGHTPIELSGHAGKVITFPAKKAGKIYPNDPCPCGSEKKDKNCCGKGGGK